MIHSNIVYYDLLFIFLYNSLGAIEVELFCNSCFVFLVHIPYKIYLCILKKRQTIQCTIDKNIKVTYHFLYVTSNICESLDNESVIALLHLQNMYFLDSVVQLHQTFCYFHKQQKVQKKLVIIIHSSMLHTRILMFYSYILINLHYSWLCNRHAYLHEFLIASFLSLATHSGEPVITNKGVLCTEGKVTYFFSY